MTIEERIPFLSDKELDRLKENALRLSQSGTDKEKVAASALLPLINARIDERTDGLATTKKAARSAAVAKHAPAKAKL